VVLDLAVFVQIDRPEEQMRGHAISALIGLLSLTLGFAPNRSLLDDTRVISFDVSVTDRNGSPVLGLTKGNFRVFENDVERTVTRVSAMEKPLAVVVVVELSADAAIENGMRPAEDLLNALGPQDWGAIVAFNLVPDIAVDFTHDKTVLVDGVCRVTSRFFADPALFDSVSFVIDRMKNLDQKGGILLLGTGRDTISFNRTYGDALRRAEKTNTRIYTVSVGRPLVTGSDSFADYAQEFQFREAQNTLRSFADASGGLAFEPQFDGQYSSIGRTVIADLKNQYTVTFAAASPGVDGKLRRLRVEVVGTDTDYNGKPDKLKVRHKRGY
jgi:VWFA-related protein